MAHVDTANWSGEGTFTHALVERLQAIDAIAFLRVEDAPASRSEADYNFISNEVYVSFTTARKAAAGRWLGVIPVTRTVEEPTMTMGGLETVLAGESEIGPPDYGDDTMLQYLRAERIIPPYQSKGYKLVELVRIYQVDARRR